MRQARQELRSLEKARLSTVSILIAIISWLFFSPALVTQPRTDHEQVQGWLGVRVHVDKETRAGLLVETVFGGSPAEAAGLRQGDILLAIDGITLDAPVFERRKQLALLCCAKPGIVAMFKIERNGTTSRLPVVAGSLPPVEGSPTPSETEFWSLLDEADSVELRKAVDHSQIVVRFLPQELERTMPTELRPLFEKVSPEVMKQVAKTNGSAAITALVVKDGGLALRLPQPRGR